MGVAALSADERQAFENDGLVRLPGLIPEAAVRRARDSVLEALERLGLWKDGAWRLDAREKPRWPDSGVKASRQIGNRRPGVEALLNEPAILAVADQLLEGRPFERRIYPRPQILFTLPNADSWFLPGHWHCDCPRLGSGRSPGVQMFACLDLVEPGGGGTVVVAGSHRLLNVAQFIRPSDITRRLAGSPFFRDLFAGGRTEAEGEADGVHLHVRELVGEPGDAWFMDLRVLHSAAPNASSRPRMMATHRFLREDVTEELSSGFGWTPVAQGG